MAKHQSVVEPRLACCMSADRCGSSLSKLATAIPTDCDMQAVGVDCHDDFRHDVTVFDDRTLDQLRRQAVAAGLTPALRPVYWKLLLGFSSPQRELWTFKADCRRRMYIEYLDVAKHALYPAFHEEPVISAFIIYTAMHRYCSVTSPHMPRAPLESLPILLSDTDLVCLRAMRDVLTHVYAEDGEYADANVFWCLVMLTGRQRRVAVSDSGHFLQSFGVGHRVVAYSKHLAVVDPTLDNIITRYLGIDHSTYADKWFRSYFALPLAEASSKQPSIIPRLWDALVASPFELIVHVALAFVTRLKPRIQQIYSSPRENGSEKSASARVLSLLENIPEITLDDIDGILLTICHATPGLFRRGRRLDDVAENAISFNVHWPVLRQNSVNSDLVKVCQYLLRAKGLGSIFFVADGTYGTKTQHAVKRFRNYLSQRPQQVQARNQPNGDMKDVADISSPSMGLHSDEEKVVRDEEGTVGPDIWEHLVEVVAPRSKRGFAVKALQTALKDIHGFRDVRVDGYYGKYTFDAVTDFQSNYAANLIDVDGVVGSLTWLHLLGDQRNDD